MRYICARSIRTESVERSGAVVGGATFSTLRSGAPRDHIWLALNAPLPHQDATRQRNHPGVARHGGGVATTTCTTWQRPGLSHAALSRPRDNPRYCALGVAGLPYGLLLRITTSRALAEGRRPQRLQHGNASHCSGHAPCCRQESQDATSRITDGCGSVRGSGSDVERGPPAPSVA
jgi:hypothetical protein